MYDLKRNTYYRYKHAIKQAKKGFDQGRSDEIHSDLTNNNSTKFWKSWQSLHGKQDKGATRIKGKVDSRDIANEFAMSFKVIYDEANSDQAKQLSREFLSLYRDY